MRNKLTGLMLSASLLLSGLPVFSKTYTDVPANEWYASYIESISNKGLMSGYENGNFGPNDRITRGMLAQILYNRDGKPDIASPVLYGDVPESAFYKNAVSWVSANGYMTGYGNGLFGGQDDISREQMITALQRYALKKGNFNNLPAAPGDITKFPDYSQISDFAIGPMNWAYALGIVGGGAALNPQGKTSRAEAAKMLDVADDMINQRSDSQPSQEPSDQEDISELAAKNRNVIQTNGNTIIALKKDGTAVVSGTVQYGNNGDFYYSTPDISGWDHLKAVGAGALCIYGLKDDGTVLVKGDFLDIHLDPEFFPPDQWTDIKAINSNNSAHIIGQKKDGSIIAEGYNYYEQCELNNWTDIVDFTTGLDNSFGVKSDGTVVAKGRNNYGQCNVSDWRDIITVSSDLFTTVGLKKDGTVVAVGDNSDGQMNVSEWKDIVSIAEGPSITVGLKKDGTVIATGTNLYGQCNVSEWKNIISVATIGCTTFGLKKDGTIVMAGLTKDEYFDFSDIKTWTNIGQPD